MMNRPDFGSFSLLIGGELVAAGPGQAVVDPSTGAELGFGPEASSSDVDAAVAAAVASGDAWALSTEDERRGALRSLRDGIESRRDEIATVLAFERGKPFSQSLGEVDLAVRTIDYYRKAAIPHDIASDTEIELVTISREATGVVAGISPWNSPFQNVVHKMAVALLVGNTFVGKPSPYTPFSTLMLGPTVVDCLPKGVVSLVAGGDGVGAYLSAHPDVQMVSFTGSIGAGRAIMGAAAPSLKRLSLELGGNDPAIVLPDVNVADASSNVFRAAFMFTGQVCSAIKRLYVHADIFESFVAALVQLAEAELLGGPFEPDVTMGPVATRTQFARIENLVADAVDQGGQVRCGGHALDRPGFFYPPTIITGVSRGTALVDEEQFGPVLPVMQFTDLESVIVEANDSPYGLGASVWSANTTEAMRVARRLRAGTVWVNRHCDVRAEFPFGGFRQSGIGRERGAIGIEQNAEIKVTSIRRAKSGPR